MTADIRSWSLLDRLYCFFFLYQNQKYIQRDITNSTWTENEMQLLQSITASAFRAGPLVNYTGIARNVVPRTDGKKWYLCSLRRLGIYSPSSAHTGHRTVKTPGLYVMNTGLASYLIKRAHLHIMRIGVMAGSCLKHL